MTDGPIGRLLGFSDICPDCGCEIGDHIYCGEGAKARCPVKPEVQTSPVSSSAKPTEEMILAGGEVLLAACASDHPWKPFDVAQIAIKVWAAMEGKRTSDHAQSAPTPSVSEDAPNLEETDHWIKILSEGKANLDHYEMREISVALRLLCEENANLSNMLKAWDAQIFELTHGRSDGHAQRPPHKATAAMVEAAYAAYGDDEVLQRADDWLEAVINAALAVSDISTDRTRK